jgi:taurine dioxygenase
VSVVVRPLSPSLGAAVTGVDLDEPLDEEQFAALHAAFLDHLVLVFPGQHVAPAAQEDFARWWGEPLVVPYLAAHAVDGHPAVLQVRNVGKANTVTESWHFDSAFFPHPPPITILAAQVVPPVGGDTMWANQYAAYDALSDRMKELLGGLRAEFTGSAVADDGARRLLTTAHPVVRTHPETGRPALAVGHPGDSVVGFEGMTADESLPLLTFLYQHASRPDFTYRHRWSAGDVVMWDNRCTIHYAVHDYGDEERTLNRVTIAGAA